MKARLVLERAVLILSVFVLAGNNRCTEDYFFATQTNIALTATGTPTSNGTITATPTTAATETEEPEPTETEVPESTETPEATATGSTSSDTSSSSSAASLLLGRHYGVLGQKNAIDASKSAGLLDELATLDKPEIAQATKTPSAQRDSTNLAAAAPGGLDSNWLGGLYDKSDQAEVPAGAGAKIAGNQDSDGDGYVDGLEEGNNTDLSNPKNFPDWLKTTNLSVRLKGNDDDGDGVSNSEEKAQGTDSFKQDSDGDGVADGAEKLSGSNALDIKSLPMYDSDGDGLSDDYERAQGTNVNSADSDSDGSMDSFEVAIGSNPIIKDTDQDGILDGREIQSGSDPIIADVKK